MVEGAGCDNKTGRYELCGIISHEGRTAEGGHYIAWVKKNGKTWYVFDDETVAEWAAVLRRITAGHLRELLGSLLQPQAWFGPGHPVGARPPGSVLA